MRILPFGSGTRTWTRPARDRCAEGLRRLVACAVSDARDFTACHKEGMFPIPPPSSGD